MKRWILVWVAVAALAATSADKSFEKSLSSDEKISHALSRLTFGARPGDVEAVKSMGLDNWLDQQLHPERLAENPELTRRLADLPTLKMSSREAADRYQIPLKEAAKIAGGDEGAKKKAAGPNGPAAVVRELTEAKLLRAIYSERQLDEQMADFWFNHFNVNIAKGADRMLTTSYERDAIRPYIWGKFRDLLGAVAHHPAMLFYLDNWQSSSPEAQTPRRLRNFGQAKGKKQVRAINENYARELMELHTLGVDNGYTQKDIVEVARCLTGWTILQPRQGGEFIFNSRMHDPGEKTVLGVKIRAGGWESDGERVLDILSRRPETAHFVSLKIAERFVADDPPAVLVDRMAKKFRETDGDLRAVVKTMIDSPEFFSEGARQAKVKTPFEFLVSAIRATQAEVRNPMPLAKELNDLGQPLYRKVEPTGYSTMADEWLNSGSLLARMNFAVDLASNKLQGIRVASADAKQLGSPEFQRK